MAGLPKPAQANSFSKPRSERSAREFAASVASDQNRRQKRAAKRRRREQKLRVERAHALANPAKAKTPPAVVSVLEFRKAIGVGHTTVHRWLRDGTIASVKVNRRRLIPFSEIERLKGVSAPTPEPGPK